MSVMERCPRQGVKLMREARGWCAGRVTGWVFEIVDTTTDTVIGTHSDCAEAIAAFRALVADLDAREAA